ncbi:LysR substrate-binding domain-containing protein [Klebsiella pneumoniae]|uniref:LysR substrate-binding domain-containing protein n=1 Tax=Klebsiella pneumoniae TaxID=573 RepID=UPI0007D6CC41|nr:LysR family transcriptional regulator [Klebsiella pneumoniae]
MSTNMLEHMEIFVQVVEQGSFTRAADVLQMHRPTVSKAVQHLEDELGIKLLHRTTRKLSLTAEGEVFFQRARGTLNDVSDMMASFSSTQPPRGRLRLDAPLALIHPLILPAISDFQKKYPEIEIILTASDKKTDLVAEGVDCVLRLGELDDSSFISRRLGQVRMATCAAPDYILRYGIPDCPDDLIKHKGVNFFSEHSREMMDWKFVVNGNVVSRRPESSVLVNNSDVLVNSGLAGLGIVHALRVQVAPYIRSGELVEILTDYSAVTKPVSLLWPDRRYLSSKVRVFIEWVSELFVRQQDTY